MDLKGRNSYSIIRMYVLYKNIYIYNLLHWIDYISNFLLFETLLSYFWYIFD